MSVGYYQSKEELEQGIDSVMEETINSTAKVMAYRTIGEINLPEESFGNITLKENYEYIQPHEVASWHTDYEIKKGEYQAKVNTREGDINVYFEAKAKLKDSYTPSLLGGVAVGEEKSDPDIGKETTKLQGVYSVDKFDLEQTNDKYISEIKKDNGYIQYSINYDNEEIKKIIEKRKLEVMLDFTQAAKETMLYLLQKDRKIISSKIEGLGEKERAYEVVLKALNKPENMELFKRELERNIEINIKERRSSKLNNDIEEYTKKISKWEKENFEVRERFEFQDFVRKNIKEKIEELQKNKDERVYNATYKEIKYLSQNIGYNNYLENKMELTEENFEKLLNKAVGQLNSLDKKHENKISRKI